MIIEGAEYYGNVKEVNIKDIVEKLEKEFGKVTITGNDTINKILTFKHFTKKRTVEMY